MALNWLTVSVRNLCTAGGTEMSILIQHFTFNKNSKLMYGRIFFLVERISKTSMWRNSVKMCTMALKISLYCICVMCMYEYYICIYMHIQNLFPTLRSSCYSHLHFQSWFNPLDAVFVKPHNELQKLSVPAERRCWTSFQDEFKYSWWEENWDSKSVPKFQDDRYFFS